MTGRLTHAELDRLYDAVCGSDSPPPPEQRHAVRALYALLRAGQPVTPQRLADETGWDLPRAREVLAGLPDTDRDDSGAIVGFGGLTLRPTPHRVVVDGQVRYAWCAWDTLFLPVALGTAEVTSRCPQTGQPITLTVAPTGVVERQPPTVVMSFVQPRAVDTADLRESFCGEVHFLADPDAAAAWTAQSANRLVLDLDDAFELGRRMILARCRP